VKLRPPNTATGIELFTVELLPSWPDALFPQQYAAPLAIMPHAWAPPALTVVKFRVPETATGTELFVVE
jgi:hypothetical protein